MLNQEVVIKRSLPFKMTALIERIRVIHACIIHDPLFHELEPRAASWAESLLGLSAYRLLGPIHTFRVNVE